MLQLTEDININNLIIYTSSENDYEIIETADTYKSINSKLELLDNENNLNDKDNHNNHNNRNNRNNLDVLDECIINSFIVLFKFMKC